MTRLTLAEAHARLTYCTKALASEPDMTPYRRTLLEAAAGEAADRIGGPRCQTCHLPLTDPESVARGVGPDCWARQAGQVA